jgi:hypothetical protein
MKDFSTISTHHYLKVYGKLKYDIQHTVVYKISRTVFHHSLHSFPFCIP